MRRSQRMMRSRKRQPLRSKPAAPIFVCGIHRDFEDEAADRLARQLMTELSDYHVLLYKDVGLTDESFKMQVLVGKTIGDKQHAKLIKIITDAKVDK